MKTQHPAVCCYYIKREARLREAIFFSCGPPSTGVACGPVRRVRQIEEEHNLFSS